MVEKGQEKGQEVVVDRDRYVCGGNTSSSIKSKHHDLPNITVGSCKNAPKFKVIEITSKENRHEIYNFLIANAEGTSISGVRVFPTRITHPPSDDTLHAALLETCTKGDLQRLTTLLISEDIDINARNNAGVSGLVLASSKGKAAIVAMLLQHPCVDVNLVGYRGRGALHNACLRGHADIARLLLEDPRATANIVDEEGRTPYFDAVRKDRKSILRLFDSYEYERFIPNGSVHSFFEGISKDTSSTHASFAMKRQHGIESRMKCLRLKAIHAYAIGDLDDPFWGKTRWFAALDECSNFRFDRTMYDGEVPLMSSILGVPISAEQKHGETAIPPNMAHEQARIIAIAMVYCGLENNCLQALVSEDDNHLEGFAATESLAALLQHLALQDPTFPDIQEAHLTGGLQASLEEKYTLSGIPHCKLILDTSQSNIQHLQRIAAAFSPKDTVQIGASFEIARLSSQDGAAAETLARTNPHSWFESHVLSEGPYFGIWRRENKRCLEEKHLVCMAGTHVFTQRYAVAALGNIVTDPKYHRRGLAKVLSARLCLELLCLGVAVVSLNVARDNHAALGLYEKIGFSKIAEYEEFQVRPKWTASNVKRDVVQ